jgi:hypothetical protein
MSSWYSGHSVLPHPAVPRDHSQTHKPCDGLGKSSTFCYTNAFVSYLPVLPARFFVKIVSATFNSLLAEEKFFYFYNHILEY